MRSVFEAHGGSIEKIIGDAIVAVFGLPFRHEDDPIRAVEAAAETQRALTTLNVELLQLWGVELVNRTGIATGIVHFGRDAEGQHVLIGETMDASTAMEQNAPPLEVLMAESAYREVRDFVEAEDMGRKSPKGSDLQIQSYRLVAVHARTAPADAAAPEPSAGMRLCAVCGEESPERHRYCMTCGASMMTSVARDSRKTVTIVFANPKPSTESGEPLEPRAFTDVMTRYFEAMKVALERHGGTVEKFIGDAVMAVFGLPTRHEDDALRAVRAAADMQAALPALNEAFARQYQVQLLNHIGVNTGEVIATGDASTGQRLVTGDAVNTAARLEQAAGAAEIILAEFTHRLTRDHTEVEAIPPLMLKGKAEPVPAYRLVRVLDRPADTTASATPFVGREVELARLSEALRGAAGERRARLVTVVGDAGVGKSRLIREFARTAGGEAALFRGRCLPYGDGITFWPLAEVVREATGIESEDSTEAAIEKIRGLIGGIDDADDRAAVTDRVASMMNLSATQFPVKELMWGIRRLLEAMAGARPVVLIIDDIHSAEQTFLDTLDYLLEAVDESPILILCSARHELLERYADWSATHAGETISLAPMSDAETGSLVAELLGDLDPSVRARISDAAEGNPLYTEQIVSMLQETGAIRRDGDRWVPTRTSGELAIPPTVQALVAARLDALGSEERAVIEPASVIGLAFADEAVAELVEDESTARLELDLGSLAAKELIRPAGGEEGLYRFGHQVIKDTAYGSLLKRIRAALHERFVVWAERVNKERGRETEFEEILGYHLEQAYRYRIELGVVDDAAREVGERAAVKLASAGRRALARGDLLAAINLLRRAAGVLARTATFRLEVLLDLSEGLLQRGAFDEATATLAEVREISVETGDRRIEARARITQALVDQASGEGDAAAAISAARGAIAVLEPLNDVAGLARAWRVLMLTDGLRGRLDEAGQHAERVIEYAKAAGDSRLAARSAGTIAYILLHGPTPVADAIPLCEDLIANVGGDRNLEAVLVGTLAVLRAMEGQFDEARRLYRRGQEIAAELGPGLATDSSSIDTSKVELLAGDAEAAERELRRDVEALAAIDETYFRSTIAAYLAQVLWLRGDAEGALRYSKVAEEIGDPEDVLTQVPWRSTRAKVLASRGEADTARSLATEAVDLAAATPQLRLRADALVDLADVLEAVGDHESAGPPVREALRLFEQKGDIVSAGRLRQRIDLAAL
jgi:class 3 adenylate cyclase/tetratricopeptide (TPR) repeat protein